MVSSLRTRVSMALGWQLPGIAERPGLLPQATGPYHAAMTYGDSMSNNVNGGGTITPAPMPVTPPAWPRI